MSKAFVTVSEQQLKQAERLLSHVKGGAGRAVSLALNRSISTARSDVVKGVRETYTVDAKSVRESVRLKSSKPNKLEASIYAFGGPLSLSHFQVKPKTVNGRRRTAIRVGVRKGSAKSMGKAFVARVGGNLQIFERVGKARLPIQKMWGPSVPQMVGNENIIDKVAEKARVSMDKRLTHEIGRLIEGGRKR